MKIKEYIKTHSFNEIPVTAHFLPQSVLEGSELSDGIEVYFSKNKDEFVTLNRSKNTFRIIQSKMTRTGPIDMDVNTLN